MKYLRSPCITHTASCNHSLQPLRDGFAATPVLFELTSSPRYARESATPPIQLYASGANLDLYPFLFTPVRVPSSRCGFNKVRGTDFLRGTRNREERRNRRKRKQAWERMKEGQERIKCRNRARNVTGVIAPASVAVASSLLLPLLDPASPSAVHLALVSSVLQQGGSWP